MINPGVSTLAKYTKCLENKSTANPEEMYPFWLITNFVKHI